MPGLKTGTVNEAVRIDVCLYKQKPCKKVFKTYQVGKKSSLSFITGLQYISENYTNAFNVWVTDEYHFYYLEMCMYASRTGQ